MSTEPELQDAAVSLATGLLNRRLQVARIATTRPEMYFTCEPESPQPFPGGCQVRVKTWRHWSDAHVELDADSGELMAWSVTSHLDPATKAEMSQAQAMAAVAQDLARLPGAEVESFYNYDYGPGRRAARIQFRHLHGGLRVDGDYFWAVIHPVSGKIIEWARKWRTVRLP